MVTLCSQRPPFSVLHGVTEEPAALPFASVIKTFPPCSEFRGDQVCPVRSSATKSSYTVPEAATEPVQ